jgi:hypothetical protein
MRRLSTLPDPVQDGGPRLRVPIGCIKASGASNGHRHDSDGVDLRRDRRLGRPVFKSLGHEDWFYYYLTGMIGISLMVYLFMRDTKADSAMHRHE